MKKFIYFSLQTWLHCWTAISESIVCILGTIDEKEPILSIPLYFADVATLSNRGAVEQCQEKVNTTLLEYCSTFYQSIRDKFGQLLVRLPEIRLISLRAEDYLYFRHLSGDIQESTLLMEMLHSKRK